MTTPLEVLDESSVDAIAELCSRALDDAPTANELRKTVFHPEQPALVRGDPDVGVVATVEGEHHQGFVRLVVVDPEHRREGHGRALLEAAEADLKARGATSVTVGSDAPYFLWPGVESSSLALICLLEARRYQRGESNFNMDVNLDEIPADPGGWLVAGPGDRDEVAAWSQQHWANWHAEIMKALDQDGLVISRDASGISAICCHDVNRHGLVGPVASRPDLLGKGAGRAPLLGALHRMHEAGQRNAEVAWVGPIRPYAVVGGTIGRVFFVYRKELR